MTKVKKRRKSLQLKPTQILVFGFLIVIFIGTILLNLPISSKNGQSVGWIDALFTSTSAVCVTGLAVKNTFEYWSAFGKWVILILIQIGGLGFMTFATALFIIMGRKISLKERLVIQEAFNQYTFSGVVRLVKNILFGTLIVELIGALLLGIRFIPAYADEGIGVGIFNSIFHSISAFCNAGFDNTGNSLVPYSNDVLINFTIMALIILGGLGFTVWLDLIRVTKAKRKERLTLRKWFNKLSLHTKLVLVLTVSLIVFGFFFFFIVEYNNPNTLGGMSFGDKILAAMFQSVTPRTAGFNSFDLSQMKHASLFMTIIYMFIGGSPAGTAGGIKTVTIGVIVLTIISVIKGKEHTEIFNKRIPENSIKKALTVLGISLTVVITVTMLLSLSEQGTFLEIFFEAMSAFGTVGLSIGLTSHLTTFGKIIVCMTMFIGRLGPVTMALAITLKRKSNSNSIKKPEEKIMVG